MSSEETYNTIVIGGGQAGLAAGYYLSQRGENYIILDENDRTGATWRKPLGQPAPVHPQPE